MPRPHASTDSKRFASGVAAFLTSLSLDIDLPDGFRILDPYRHDEVVDVVRQFCATYYAGNQKRVAVWGINPGRFGGGVTGLSFTDPVALVDLLGLKTTIAGRREPSAQFVSMVIEAYGGPKNFYRDFYLSALSPLGFEAGGKNINFYDDADLARRIAPVIRAWMLEQHALGLVADRCVVLGTGKLRDYMERTLRLDLSYTTVEYLEHPRFIMQYRRRQVSDFVDKYVETLLRIKG